MVTDLCDPGPGSSSPALPTEAPCLSLTLQLSTPGLPQVTGFPGSETETPQRWGALCGPQPPRWQAKCLFVRTATSGKGALADHAEGSCLFRGVCLGPQLGIRAGPLATPRAPLDPQLPVQ